MKARSSGDPAAPDSPDDRLFELMRLIALEDADGVERVLAAEPSLACHASTCGATRQDAERFFLESIRHYVYAGDTALHVAAAGFRVRIVEVLLHHGAACEATNRRGARPLHYAADTNTWSPEAQAATIRCLLENGADPNAADANGATPLHRAVRTRSAPAVEALLVLGASPNARNKSESTPLGLAGKTTGRGGSGRDHAREQQRLIVALLMEHGADPGALASKEAVATPRRGA